MMIFLPTPSARRATTYGNARCIIASISTHALREEGDDRMTVNGKTTEIFLPTPSARRATAQLTDGGIDPVISTHALREEGD